jgi:hypothetical protein
MSRLRFSPNPLKWPDWLLLLASVAPTVVLVCYVAATFRPQAVFAGAASGGALVTGAAALMAWLAYDRPSSEPARPRMWAPVAGAAVGSVATLIQIIWRTQLTAIPHHLNELVVMPAVNAILIGGVLLAIAAWHQWTFAVWNVHVALVTLGIASVTSFAWVAQYVPAGAVTPSIKHAAIWVGVELFIYCFLVALLIAPGVRLALVQRRRLGKIAICGFGIAVAAAFGAMGPVSRYVAPGWDTVAGMAVALLIGSYFGTARRLVFIAVARRQAEVVVAMWGRYKPTSDDPDVIRVAAQLDWAKLLGPGVWSYKPRRARVALLRLRYAVARLEAAGRRYAQDLPSFEDDVKTRLLELDEVAQGRLAAMLRAPAKEPADSHS